MLNLIRAALAATILALAPLAAWAEAAKVAIHVDEESIRTMTMALNNATNIIKHYEDLGQEVTVEIVTYGPGLHMLRTDTSPVSDRISQMGLLYENLSFSACQNTLDVMQQRSQTEITLLPEANVVPSGAVRLMELQYEGYAYLRP